MISKEEVLKAAKLARLKLTDHEVERYQQQLGSILKHVEAFDQLDLNNISPTAQIGDDFIAMRDDHVITNTIREKALKNAPDSEDTFFKVPQVIGS